MAIPSITAPGFCLRKFDYLVVGGGTAGLVVAARLSENPDITVGVLEAGPAALDDPIINVPGRFGESLGTRYDWQFETTPQPGLNGRSIPWNRGRVLGGTSALNFMTWNRGNRQDFDAWEELGNKGWGWDSLLPFFKKTETFHKPSAEHQALHSSHFESEFHGTNGPVSTVHSKEFSVPHQFWHQTLRDPTLGVATNKSQLSGANSGAFTTLTSVHPDTRTRCYSTTAYYLPNASRSNLVVLTEAVVENLLLEKDHQDDWLAKGVSFRHGGEAFVASAGREVILCAGSVQSPQLLELSGVGNPAVLAAAGISVKVSNPNVGENLQDHMMTAMIFEMDSSIVGPDELRANPQLAEAADLAYETTQSGVRTMLPCALSYVPVSHVLPSMASELMSKVLTPHSSLRDRVLAKQFSPDVTRGQIEYLFDVGNWSPYHKSEPGKVYGTMLMMLQLPLSKGSVHIPPSSSTGPPTSETKPVIDPQYYGGDGGEVDLEIMTAGQKFAAKICSTAPLSSVIKSRVFPARGSTDEEDFTDFVRNCTVSDWHPVGSCGMGGSDGIAAGVVDDRLRVYGVRGLRVVDASIMPLQICAHIQATIYAIAEKGAAMILEDRGNSSV